MKAFLRKSPLWDAGSGGVLHCELGQPPTMYSSICSQSLYNTLYWPCPYVVMEEGGRHGQGDGWILSSQNRDVGIKCLVNYVKKLE